jgi:hypothetical protein
VPSEPPGKEEVVINNAAATVIESDLVVEAPAPSETWIVKPGAVAVGVPEMRPLVELRLSPAGSEPESTDQVRGEDPPDVATVWE